MIGAIYKDSGSSNPQRADCAQAIGADAVAHQILQPWAAHKVVLAHVQVPYRRLWQRILPRLTPVRPHTLMIDNRHVAPRATKK